jgi:hypothetical protein
MEMDEENLSERERSMQGCGLADPDWIRIQLGQWIRIRNPDPGGQKWPTKVEKKISCFEVLDVLFWELKASSVTWMFFMEVYGQENCSFWPKKILKKFQL